MDLRPLKAVAFVPLALTCLSCSDPVAPPAQGAVYLVIQGPPPGSPDSCPSGSTTLSIQAKDITLSTTSNKGTLVSEGDGANVSCSVKRSGTISEGGKNYNQFAISANASKNQNSFSFNGTVVENGGAEAKVSGSLRGTGSGSVNLYQPQIFQMSSEPGQDCLVKDVIEIGAGKVWATVDCSKIKDTTQANKSCSINGSQGSVFAFANCEN